MLTRLFRWLFFRDEVEMFWGDSSDVHDQVQKFMALDPVIISIAVTQSGFPDDSGQFPAPNRETVVVLHYR
jgi:hypothetical protein